ncbi:hypothetical protein MgSA37_02273 [Mucilaginibacter gotjawali]|uniref:Uncharacterized protein n=2 Tax=Mucilaginibacter gotjawali TaxID=1550579 RepID=A0A110B2U0_9SPHI|nr:hypothetical protein [Mucilaginibacter gotjawali]BAU54102.1 hypothetical protein MgSA37_02273 [Mucilaginibacter gotjawali]
MTKRKISNNMRALGNRIFETNGRIRLAESA